MANLTQAQVTFHSNDEDKNDDTHLTITVRGSDGTIAARIDDDFGIFKDHTDHGPFGLLIVNPAPKEKLNQGNVVIRIDPDGDDTWRFNFFLDLAFDDGSHLNTQVDGLELTDERQQQVFAIQ
ncbi:MAG: hypothetical protein ACREDT_05495 [Methylocella sp.]